MTRKAKSEKLAKSLRALRSNLSHEGQNINKESSISALSKEDALKTFFTTALVISTVALVFVLQAKGYIR